MLMSGVVVIATACGSDDGGSSGPETATAGSAITSVSTRPVTTEPTSDAPVGKNGGTTPGGAPGPVAPGQPQEPGPLPDKSTVLIQTLTVQGVAIPYVPVNLRLYQPCDPASRDLPEGTPEVRRWDGLTDANGQTGFLVPVGCYRFGMEAPLGTNPVPEGLHTLFVEQEGQIVYGRLRFQDPAPDPVCASQTILHDLGEGPPYTTTLATVSECDGFWAVIVWDMPGDSQRIVHRGYDFGWRNYVYFPHDVCWSQAKADGVPANLEKYFLKC
ncbi:hypothetical protein [Nocardia sp. NPDC127526]|uniref:hypothetical protein n=1 Tax=Nocardia sp. NPDC127526 TaxID=3345393 RepID=UPI00362F9F00